MLSIKRFLGYILGFVLFYAPFALFQRIIYTLFYGKVTNATIHSACFRVQIEHLIDGKFLYLSIPSIVFIGILLLTALFFGPIFCGKLCPVGAFTEYLSKLIPYKFQITWSKYVEISVIRYGMLAGFVVLPLFNNVLACSYCNFYVFDLIINYYIYGYYVSLSSTLILTLLLWLVVLGLFTKGGRGYCNFLCPVGAIQNLLYYLGLKFGIAYFIKFDKNKCIGCKHCEKVCPMDSIKIVDNKPFFNIHNCIICGECAEKCPVKAISYLRKRDKNEK